MTEDVPVKRKRGRPRKNPAEAEVLHARARPPVRARDPRRGEARLERGVIADYTYSDTTYQFKVVRRVEVEGATTWIWGSTKGTEEVDMVVEENECLLIRGCV